MHFFKPGEEVVKGRYTYVRQLGRGGMGAVLECTDVKLKRAVALKVMLVPELSNEALAQRFMREAQQAAQIKSDHVVDVYELGKLDTGEPYIAMAMLRGRDLKEVLETDSPLSVSVAVGYVLEACEGLVQVHNKGIVHRDIKPANLFLDVTDPDFPSIKILDFGIAKNLIADELKLTTDDQPPMGTVLYMSPEQREKKEVGITADIWALGYVLYEMISGHLPFSQDELHKPVLQGEAPRISLIVPEAHDEVEAAIVRCLQKNPEDRFPNVAQLAGAICRFGPPGSVERTRRIVRMLRSSSLTPTPPPAAVVTEPKPRETPVPKVSEFAPPPIPPARPSDAASAKSGPADRRSGDRRSSDRRASDDVPPNKTGRTLTMAVGALALLTGVAATFYLVTQKEPPPNVNIASQLRDGQSASRATATTTAQLPTATANTGAASPNKWNKQIHIVICSSQAAKGRKFIDCSANQPLDAATKSRLASDRSPSTLGIGAPLVAIPLDTSPPSVRPNAAPQLGASATWAGDTLLFSQVDLKFDAQLATYLSSPSRSNMCFTNDSFILSDPSAPFTTRDDGSVELRLIRRDALPAGAGVDEIKSCPAH